MPHGHVESRFRRSVGGETVFHLAEESVRSRVAGHKDNGADRYVGLEKLLRCYDGSDSVGVKMESKLVKGTGRCQRPSRQ
jgi:hypothetical protein